MKPLEKQPTEQEPKYVDDYPYGYNKRTTIRYWVETTKHGQRFIRQTKNPATDKWNKPKKSTYSNIILVGEKDNGHITYCGLINYSSEEVRRIVWRVFERVAKKRT